MHSNNAPIHPKYEFLVLAEQVQHFWPTKLQKLFCAHPLPLGLCGLKSASGNVSICCKRWNEVTEGSVNCMRGSWLSEIPNHTFSKFLSDLHLHSSFSFPIKKVCDELQLIDLPNLRHRAQLSLSERCTQVISVDLISQLNPPWIMN